MLGRPTAHISPGLVSLESAGKPEGSSAQTHMQTQQAAGSSGLSAASRQLANIPSAMASVSAGAAVGNIDVHHHHHLHHRGRGYTHSAAADMFATAYSFQANALWQAGVGRDAQPAALHRSTLSGSGASDHGCTLQAAEDRSVATGLAAPSHAGAGTRVYGLGPKGSDTGVLVASSSAAATEVQQLPALAQAFHAGTGACAVRDGLFHSPLISPEGMEAAQQGLGLRLAPSLQLSASGAGSAFGVQNTTAAVVHTARSSGSSQPAAGQALQGDAFAKNAEAASGDANAHARSLHARGVHANEGLWSDDSDESDWEGMHLPRVHS